MAPGLPQVGPPLLPGPQRYSDLQAGLPGIGTNVLVERLRALQQAGVVTRRTLPPPAGVPVYELTEAGRALRPALSALREWGTRHGSKPMPGDINRPSWMLLSLMSGGLAMTAGRSCGLRVDGEMFTVSDPGSGITVESGAGRHSQATVTLARDDLTGLMTGRRARKAARARAQVEGDETAALELLTLLDGAWFPPAHPADARQSISGLACWGWTWCLNPDGGKGAVWVPKPYATRRYS
jgi:DNA-binding HxlR family transcriptional regulator